jgi:hypothetical protein
LQLIFIIFFNLLKLTTSFCYDVVYAAKNVGFWALHILKVQN